jgi:cytochrome b561
MALRNSSESFGSVARALHWGMALLIVAAIALIELADVAPRGSALRRGMRDWHMQAGLVVLALVGFRLAWRLANPIPSIVPALPAWQQRVAHGVEWTFYALMIALPMVGIAMRQADGRVVSLLGWSLPTLLAPDKGLAHTLEEIHETLGNAMIVLVCAHVAAALWHRFVLRDNTLARMR